MLGFRGRTLSSPTSEAIETATNACALTFGRRGIQLPTYVRFYLNGVPLQVIDNVDDPSCSLPGTLAAVDSDHPLGRPGFHTISNINDVDGRPFAILSGYR